MPTCHQLEVSTLSNVCNSREKRRFNRIALLKLLFRYLHLPKKRENRFPKRPRKEVLAGPTLSFPSQEILHLPFLLVSKKNSSFFKPRHFPRGKPPNINTPSQHLNRPTSAEARGFAFFWALGTATETATATTTALLQKTPSSLLTRDEILYSTNCHQVMFVGFCFFCKKMVLSEFDSMVLRCIYL